MTRSPHRLCSFLSRSFLTTRRPPRSPLFPYTTLFRSLRRRPVRIVAVEPDVDVEEVALLRPQEPREGLALHVALLGGGDRKSTRLNSSHANISYAVFCLKKKNSRDS